MHYTDAKMKGKPSVVEVGEKSVVATKSSEQAFDSV